MRIKNFKIINFMESHLLEKYNYTQVQLKTMCKHYKEKRTGNKSLLKSRLLKKLTLLKSAYIIETAYIKWKYKCFVKLQGRYSKNNSTDFYNLDNIVDIPIQQLFFIKNDKYNFAFHLESIERLLLTKNIENPYTRKKINLEDQIRFKKISILAKFLQIPYKSEQQKLTAQQKLDFNILDIFQKIEALGFLVNPQWFKELSLANTIIFLRELYDIWNYRANLSQLVKQEISPPFGNPFSVIQINSIHHKNLIDLKTLSILILNKLVNPLSNDSNKYLGACYILQALTLVSPNAAISLPWLYQTVLNL